MKKLIFAIIATGLLCGCQSFFTQELKEGKSFAGLTKVYVEKARGGQEVFNVYSLSEKVNMQVAIIACEILSEKGYTVVDSKEEAEIVFVPVWNVSYEPANDDLGSMRNMRSSSTFSISANNMIPYATLELQAWLQPLNEWAWRGFSAIQSTPSDFGTSGIKRHLIWCLQHFPPEEYPSSLEIYRQKQAEKKKAEENPFSHIVPENTSVPQVEETKQAQ